VGLYQQSGEGWPSWVKSLGVVFRGERVIFV
jgi:hypothetical protein